MEVTAILCYDSGYEKGDDIQFMMDKFLFTGDGEIDLFSRLNLAPKRGARCVLETKTSDALKKSVEWLRVRL